jgi:hypothetical protein
MPQVENNMKHGQIHHTSNNALTSCNDPDIKMVVNRTPRRNRFIPGSHAKPPAHARWSRWISLPGFGIFLAVVVALCIWLDGIVVRSIALLPVNGD